MPDQINHRSPRPIAQIHDRPNRQKHCIRIAPFISESDEAWDEGLEGESGEGVLGAHREDVAELFKGGGGALAGWGRAGVEAGENTPENRRVLAGDPALAFPEGPGPVMGVVHSV